MKKILVLLTALLLISLVTIMAYAHSGRTDSNGGHYDRSTGEYHYHHGRPAHRHPNGRCPYDTTDDSDYTDSTSSSSQSYDITDSSSDFYDKLIALSIVTVSFLGYFIVAYVDIKWKTLTYIIVALWFFAIGATIICFINFPGFVLLSVIIEGIISFFINSKIEDYKDKKDKDKDE
jgi:hypothetical protein